MSRWYALSTHFLSDEKVTALGERHGPAGPLVVVALLCRAKTQAQAGKVDGSYRDLAHQAFVDRKELEAILKDALSTGLVEGEVNGTGYKLAFPAWNRWQSASRMAMKRERDKRQRNVTQSDEALREVTNNTIQDNTETPMSAKADVEVVFKAWQEATGRPKTTLTKARAALIARRLREFSVEDLVDAVCGIGASKFHAGENDRGKRYNDIELALRDAAHIERFRDEYRGEAIPQTPHPFV